MLFNDHYGVDGHAFLSPSQTSWVNYDDEKLVERYATWKASERGTRIHALAAELIDLGIKLPHNGQTLSMYVNDALNYVMRPEQVLYFSENCYGTADAISFRRNLLRIHDLKTGVHPASMRQLRVYMALFCLEYKRSPKDIRAELRIYQNNDVSIEIPDPKEIMDIMAKIRHFNQIITEMQAE